MDRALGGMCSLLALVIGSSCGTGCDGEIEMTDRAADLEWRLEQEGACSRLRVHESGRWLADERGEVVFLLGDTAWAIGWKLGRTEVVEYLRHRRGQGFNAIGVIAYPFDRTRRNVYGDMPFEVDGEEWDPSRRLFTPGSDPQNPEEYDYWDHLEYVIDRACETGLYVILSPTFGDFIAGTHHGVATKRTIFDVDLAYEYGHWMGDRFREKRNLIWLLGGDRNAVGIDHDYRPAIRAMAEGITDGVNGDASRDGSADYATTLMTYWPRKSMAQNTVGAKGPNSSEWFHEDPWLDFNSIQDWPWDQLLAIDHDYHRTPPKPTWLFEGRYEHYRPVWTDYQSRIQAYQTVFAGGFGHVYGNEIVYFFGRDWTIGPDDHDVWLPELDSAGARSMQHLASLMRLMRDRDLAGRVPDQSLVVGDQGTTGTFDSNRVQAMRTADATLAFVYNANGRNFAVALERLAEPSMDAYWFDPRLGQWYDGTTRTVEPRPYVTNLPSGGQAEVMEFDPPGEPGAGNDWILMLSSTERLSPSQVDAAHNRSEEER